MAKRFTDSTKWQKPWFRKLPPVYKLLWMYVLDNCDHAGVWYVDMDAATYHIGEQVTVEGAELHFGDHVESFSDGSKWFISDFIEFQYSDLNEANRAHRSVILLLEKHGLRSKKEGASKPLISPLEGAKDKDKDKDKELDKDKDKILDTNASAKETTTDPPRYRSFQPPQLVEIVAEFTMQGKPLPEAEALANSFYDHYEAQNWLTGAGMKVTQWRAKARTWSRDQVARDKAASQPKASKFPVRGEYDPNYKAPIGKGLPKAVTDLADVQIPTADELAELDRLLKTKFVNVSNASP